jgi:hypothetical protein
MKIIIIILVCFLDLTLLNAKYLKYGYIKNLSMKVSSGNYSKPVYPINNNFSKGDSNFYTDSLEVDEILKGKFSKENNLISCLKMQNLKLTSCYIGFGGNFGHQQSFFPKVGLSGTFLLSNNWGGNINFKVKDFKADVPKDYSGGSKEQPFLFGSFSDYLSISTLNVVREFPTRMKRLRFGIELGLSWLTYSKLKFNKIAPFYKYYSINGDTFSRLIINNYSTERSLSSAIGFSMRTKIELPLTRIMGLELAVYANINKFQTYIGLEAYLSFGFIREKIQKEDIIQNVYSPYIH